MKRYTTSPQRAKNIPQHKISLLKLCLQWPKFNFDYLEKVVAEVQELDFVLYLQSQKSPLYISWKERSSLT